MAYSAARVLLGTESDTRVRHPKRFKDAAAEQIFVAHTRTQFECVTQKTHADIRVLHLGTRFA
jgi:hypothetical protein